MSEQPKSMRLADEFDAGHRMAHTSQWRAEAAAELRRLHEENERLHQINKAHEMKLSVRGYEIQIEDLKAVNAELLEAYIKMRASAAGYSNFCDADNANTIRCERNYVAAEVLYRAAIAKAEAA
jgi:hypothetical protein